MTKHIARLARLTLATGMLMFSSCAKKESDSNPIIPQEPTTIEQVERMDRDTTDATVNGDPEMVGIVLAQWRDTLKEFMATDKLPTNRIRRCMAMTCGRLSLLQTKIGNTSRAEDYMSEAMQYGQGQHDIDTEEKLLQVIYSQVRKEN